VPCLYLALVVPRPLLLSQLGAFDMTFVGGKAQVFVQLLAQRCFQACLHAYQDGLSYAFLQTLFQFALKARFPDDRYLFFFLAIVVMSLPFFYSPLS
jgi:hypothetical protein